MRAFDHFDDDLASWFAADAEASIEPETRDRAVAVALGGRPRPAALATIGSHWIGETDGNERAFRPVRLTNLRLGAVFVALLILAVIALLGSALFVAAPEPAGRLLYDHDGDIVLADADGGDATVVQDGAPATDPTGAYFTLVPEVWSPDGQHFVYYEYRRPADVIIHIADRTGHRVATLPILPPFYDPAGPTPEIPWRNPGRNARATNVRTWWSPDSTKLAVFPWVATEVSIYGIDGAFVTSTPLPRGYTMSREFGLSGWTPDGRSVLAMITSPAVNLQPEVWRLPLDRSGPTQVPDGDAYVGSWNLSPDGRHVAFSGHVNLDGHLRYGASPGEGADTIYIADVDGGNQRPVAGTTHFAGVYAPQWSPDGTRILYIATAHAYRFDLHVVDVASGTDFVLAKVLSDAWSPHAWSPEGDNVLIAGYVVKPRIGGPAVSQLDTDPMRANRDALVSIWATSAEGYGLELIADGVNYFGVAP